MTPETLVIAARPVAVGPVAGAVVVDVAAGVAEEGENDFEPLLRYENYSTCIHRNRPAVLDCNAGIGL